MSYFMWYEHVPLILLLATGAAAKPGLASLLRKVEEILEAEPEAEPDAEPDVDEVARSALSRKPRRSETRTARPARPQGIRIVRV